MQKQKAITIKAITLKATVRDPLRDQRSASQCEKSAAHQQKETDGRKEEKGLRKYHCSDGRVR
ncbi:MAG: hypothetical protein WCA25_07365, partial [Pseudolabrys sp.]